MTYSQAALAQLKAGLDAVPGKQEALFQAYVSREYKDKHAEETAKQGFIRRTSTMARCIDNAFTLLPPDLAEPPQRNARYDAQINLQTFVFNAFGSVENLASIWVTERGITRPNGKASHNKQIGMRAHNHLVRDTFSPEFQVFLTTLDDWFGYLENFRHALAHRIPLYVPPFVVFRDSHGAPSDPKPVNRSIRKDNDPRPPSQQRVELLESSRVACTHRPASSAPPSVMHRRSQFSAKQEGRPPGWVDALIVRACARAG